MLLLLSRVCRDDISKYDRTNNNSICFNPYSPLIYLKALIIQK